MTDTLTAAMVRHLRPPPAPPSAVELMARSGLEPDPWQTKYLTDQPDRALLCCSRQSGKSTTVAADSLHQAVSKPNSLTLLLSPSQRQSAELLDKVRQFAIAQTPAIPFESLSVLSMRLANRSRIISLPGKDETIRGYTPDLIVIDEAAMVPNTLIAAIRPMLAVSHGRLVAMSTPKGRRGWFYEAWEADNGWERVRVTALECPRITSEFLDEERATLPGVVFAQEYMCSFEEAAGAVFSTQVINEAIQAEVTSLW